MENIEKMLNQILENQMSMQEDIRELKENQISMQEDMIKMQDDMKELKENQEKVQQQLTKQSIIQEQMARDIKLLAEGHENILEIIERRDQELKKEFSDRFDEIEAAISDISNDVRFLEHKGYQNEKELFKIKESLKV
ncbi:hypothetical protein [Caloranaerobacter azorensis]|uniref:Uncharacterized protein n=1 Tax=Caloranaerobacter azorensis TaxID=116090 RepID=A0A6P1YEJ1_9FIRM|nr:hypothetical protein [Caloranaerobacter azorensis]QIB27507.1 hypothetical protein G3A45_09515 [Caloranaerobacter azorensis]